MAAIDLQEQQTCAAEKDGVTFTPLPRVLVWFWAGSVLTLVMTLVVSWLEYRAGWVIGRWYPLQFPFFWDLLEYYHTFQLVHTAPFFRNPVTHSVAYPPFGAALFGMVYALGHAVRVYMVVALMWLGCTLYGVRKALMRYGIRPLTATLFPLTLMVASFPIWRLIPQGNIELFLWIWATTGVWCYLRGRDDAAAILWGLAGATKLYPVVLLVLFVPRRKYRAFLLGVATFVLASVGSMAYLGPTIAIAWKGSLANVFGYQGIRVAEWAIHDLAGNHSTFTLVKVAAMIARIPVPPLTLPYYACGAAVFSAAFFLRVRKMPLVNQLLMVSLFMVMLPPVSYFHTFVHLYPPWFLLVFLAIRAKRAGVRVPNLHATILLFLPLFSSTTLYTFPTLMIYAGLIQSFLLCWLFFISVVTPFEEPAAGWKEDWGRERRSRKAIEGASECR